MTVRPRFFSCSALGVFAILSALSGTPALAAGIHGQVTGASAPIAGSTVTLWAASTDQPHQLAQTHTDTEGRFVLNADGDGADLYLVANGGRAAANIAAGDNSAIRMITVLGSTPPANVAVSEMTTVASVWTNAQFLAGTAIKGNALGLRIAGRDG